MNAETLKLAFDEPVASTEEAMQQAVRIYKDAKAAGADALVPYEMVMSAAKERINEIIAETGCLSWKTVHGLAYIPAPGVTVSYDAKALDALCASSPEIAALLRPHRTEKERPGSLTIR